MNAARTRWLSHADHDRILDALAQLYAQTEFTALRECMVRLASRLIGAEFGTFTEFSKPASTLGSSHRFPDVSQIVDPHAPALLAHFHEHPVLHSMLRTGRVDAQRTSDVATPGQFHRTHLYNEYFRPIQIRWQLIFAIDRPGRSSVAITLNRSARDFSARDRAVFECLRPHYARALENVARLDGLAAGVAALERLRSAGGEVTLVVNREGRVGWVSRVAREWLAAAFRGPLDVGVRVPDEVAQWLRAQPLGRAVLVAPAAPLRIACGGGAIVLRWVARDEDGNNCVVITRRTPDGEMAAPRLPELTFRENEILGWIAQGKTNPEIATIAGLSVRTVYKHLENIYRKINVENRACAMLRVLESRP